MQRSADATGWPSAFIGAIDLTSPTLAGTLAGYQELPIVRAVRQPLYWADDLSAVKGARSDFLTDPAWLRGFELVAETDLTWDLLVYDENCLPPKYYSAPIHLLGSFSRPPAGRWIRVRMDSGAGRNGFRPSLCIRR